MHIRMLQIVSQIYYKVLIALFLLMVKLDQERLIQCLEKAMNHNYDKIILLLKMGKILLIHLKIEIIPCKENLTFNKMVKSIKKKVLYQDALVNYSIISKILTPKLLSTAHFYKFITKNFMIYFKILIQRTHYKLEKKNCKDYMWKV